MPSVAEILANPAKYTPTKVLQALVSQMGYNPNGISAKLKSVGFDASPTAIHRWIKKNQPSLVPPKVKTYKPGHGPRKPAALYVKRYSKLFDRYVQRPNRAPQYAAKRRAAFANAGSLEDLANLLAKKVRVRAAPKARVRKSEGEKRVARMRAYTERYGTPQFVDAVARQIGAQVGAYSHKRKYGVRRIGSAVAMNPSFSNPAFDFSLRTIGSNVISGAQAAGGAIAGIAGAKYANQLIVAPLAKNLFKTDDAGILGRALSSLLAGTILSSLSRAFIPGELGGKMADGAFAGSVMYVAGGIKTSGGTPILPIGDLIQDKDGSYRIQSQVSAYNAIPQRVSDEMNDNMSAVSSSYDVRPVPEDSDGTEIAQGW